MLTSAGASHPTLARGHLAFLAVLASGCDCHLIRWFWEFWRFWEFWEPRGGVLCLRPAHAGPRPSGRIEQVPMRHATAGASLEQLHPALDATQGGGTRETSGVSSRARLGGRAFVLEGVLARARPGRPSTGAGCYSSEAIPACYTKSLTCPTALSGA